MKTSRIVVLLVAVGAGGVAAYLATHLATPREQPAAPRPPEVVQETTTPRVLVASREIGVGQRLSPTSLAWQDWPEGGLQSDYITLAAAPAAIADMSGSVARSEFLPGDPIRKQKLARSADSFLPALLDGGMRGVSVAITAESASGGFISPSDHVDVVLTRSSSQNESQGVSRRSETILHNVRVLAIDSRLGALGSSGAGQGSDHLQADTFIGPAIATLALDPTEAEVIVNASAIGKLSLLLRSAVDFSDTGKGAQDGVNQAIRISSPFWSR